MTETQTRLEIDERRALLARIEAIGPETRVRLTWDSNRSENDVDVKGRTVEHDETPLYVLTDERHGSVYVRVLEDHIENVHHSPLVARSTGGGGGKDQRLGELLDVEVLDG